MSKRIALISAGVSRYPSSLIETDSNLKFADKAAEEIAAFVDHVYSRDSDITLLTNEALSQDALFKCANELRGNGAYELTIVFIACHGGGDGHHDAWLYLSNPDTDMSRLRPEAFDDFLRRLPSRSVLFLLDSCFAFAFARRVPFFYEPPPKGGARIFLAAAGEQEFAWEDGRIKLPVFSKSVLDELSGTAQERLSIDVESELFPGVRDRVAAQTYQLKKGQEQSVFRGGVSSGAMQLRLAPGKDAKERYWGEAMRDGLLLWARRVAVVVAALFLAIVLFGYHLNPREDGRMEILRGVRSTAPLLPPAIARRADLPFFSETILSAASESRRADFYSGKISGVWGQRNAGGVYRWIDELIEKDALRSVNARLIVRTGINDRYLEQLIEATDWSEVGMTWAIEVLSEARLLLGTEHIDPLDGVSLDIIKTLGCDPSDASDEAAEFSWMQIQTEASSEVATRLRGIEKAILSGARGGEILLVDAARIIHARSKKAHQLHNYHTEYRAWLSAADSLKHAARYYGYALDEMAVAALGQWSSCEPVERLVLQAMFNTAPEGSRIDGSIARLIEAGRAPLSADLSWTIEFYLLATHARAQAMNADHYDSIWKALPRRGDANNPHRPDRFLWFLLTPGATPPGTQLVADYLDPANTQRHNDQVLGEMILLSATRMNDQERLLLRRSALELTNEELPFPFHDRKLAARYAHAGFLSAEEMSNYWHDEFDFRFRYPWRRGDDVISVALEAGVEDWDSVTALAEAAYALRVPSAQHSFFRDVAIEHATTQIPDIEAFFAVVGLKYSDLRGQALTDAILRSLRKSRLSAAAMIVETGAAAHFVWSLSDEDKRVAISTLRKSWARERAPQLRLALAAIILSGPSRDFTIVETLSDVGMIGPESRRW